jgi:hypothetical protein
LLQVSANDLLSLKVLAIISIGSNVPFGPMMLWEF